MDGHNQGRPAARREGLAEGACPRRAGRSLRRPPDPTDTPRPALAPYPPPTSVHQQKQLASSAGPFLKLIWIQAPLDQDLSQTSRVQKNPLLASLDRKPSGRGVGVGVALTLLKFSPETRRIRPLGIRELPVNSSTSSLAAGLISSSSPKSSLNLIGNCALHFSFFPAISKWQHANSASKSFKRQSFADRRPS